MRKIVVVFVAAFILGIVIGSAVAVRAQSSGTFNITTDQNGKILSSTKAEPVILKSDDLGLRVTSRNGKRVVGTLVARVNGEWREVQIAPQDAWVARP